MGRKRSAPVVIAIGGSDPSGGAGVQADCRSLDSLGVSPATVLTAVTVQTGARVELARALAPALVVRQLRALVDSRAVAAVKCGMMASTEIVRALAPLLADLAVPLVVDPVTIASGGERLGSARLPAALSAHLFPIATVVTANLAEAAALAGVEVSDEDGMAAAARAIGRTGTRAVVVKGGHLRTDPVDILWDGRRVRRFPSTRIGGRDMHGTGCAFAAAVAAGLAHRRSLSRSVAAAGDHVRDLIASAARSRGGAWLREPGG